MSSIADVLQQQVEAERKLSKHLADFAGEWVAIRDHQVVASADSLDALMEQIDADQVDAIFRVAEDRAVCFY